jgi:RimJ/RimL family protein N-acetyltransferase
MILRAEAAARRDGFVLGWSEAEHLDAMSRPGTTYFLVHDAGMGDAVGYAILRGLDDQVHHSIELKRFVVTVPGRGIGRAVLRELKRFAFDVHHAHRLWLDVFTDNARARHLYASEGFIEEGVLRECVRRGDAWASLVVMSLLAGEHAGA